MLSIIRALLASTLPAFVAARARVIGIHDIPAARELDTTNSSIVWITAAPGDQVLFEPPTASVNIGQVVNFIFPTNLPVSVTQSSFDDPCTYLNTSNETGFDSQLQQAVIFTLEILDEDPIYFHCKHPGHPGQGMVGALNPPTTGNETFTVFQKNAVSLGSNASNGTSGATPVSGGGSGAVGSAITSTFVSATATTPPTASDAQFAAMLRTRVWPAGALLAIACLMMTA